MELLCVQGELGEMLDQGSWGHAEGRRNTGGGGCSPCCWDSEYKGQQKHGGGASRCNVGPRPGIWGPRLLHPEDLL